jgi:hypothetical protein
MKPARDALSLAIRFRYSLDAAGAEVTAAAAAGAGGCAFSKPKDDDDDDDDEEEEDEPKEAPEAETAATAGTTGAAVSCTLAKGLNEAVPTGAPEAPLEVGADLRKLAFLMTRFWSTAASARWYVPATSLSWSSRASNSCGCI